MKRIITAIAIALTTVGASAQISHALYFMESVPQTTLLNPARQPRATLFIAVPGANVYVGENTNLEPMDFFQKKDGKWLHLLNNGFDYSDLYDKYEKQMAVDINSTVGLISFGWRTEAGNYLSFNLDERINADVSLPGDFLKIGDRGLAKGTMLDMAKLGVNAMAYTELAASYSRVIDEKWTFGVRLKLLAGSSAVKTENNDFSILMGEDKWHVKTDIEVMTSGPLETETCLKEDGTVEFDSIDVRDFDETRDYVKYFLPRLKNPGGAIDLGVVYTLNDNFRFSGSVTDLGLISWGRDINNFKSKSEWDFDGIRYDIDNDEHNDDFENALEDAVDSIMDNIHATLNHKRFTMGLRPSIYVAAEYTPVYFLNVGFLSHTKFLYSGRVNQDFGVSATLNPYKLPASLTLGYNINTMGQSAASAGFAIRFGVLQFYTAVDYAPAKYNVYHTVDDDEISAPNNISALNVSVGLNLVFGSKGFKDRPMNRSNSRIAE